jgi:hypothetical protein
MASLTTDRTPYKSFSSRMKSGLYQEIITCLSCRGLSAVPHVLFEPSEAARTGGLLLDIFMRNATASYLPMRPFNFRVADRRDRHMLLIEKAGEILFRQVAMSQDRDGSEPLAWPRVQALG